MPIAPMLSRLFLFTALFVCHGAVSAAPSGNATDAAFAALLAMPGAQPLEGGWIIPPQDEPAPGNEKELIQRLQRLQKAGADFNAMRHRGTLLAHAIRAGKEKAAIWLLAQGAKTSDLVFGDDASAGQLAQKYQRAAVEKVLIDQYRLKPPSSESSRPPKKSSTASPTIASSTSPKEQARQVIEKVRSDKFPNKANQEAWKSLSAQLSAADHAALVESTESLLLVLSLTRDTEDGLEKLLSNLPLEFVRQRAQAVADFMMGWSNVEYGRDGAMKYNATARSWPALWSRIDRPLNYDKRPGLAEHIPPVLWPGLFDSGYTQHQAEFTGCLLSALPFDTFKRIWPDFQRLFPNANDEAPSLVLKPYLLSREPFGCYYNQVHDTVAKLDFLRERGVPGKVVGLRKSRITEASSPDLMRAVATFERKPNAPRLVKSSLKCQLKFNEVWLNALSVVQAVDYGAPAEYVQALEVPGERQCALIVGGSSYPNWPNADDDFFNGPMRMGSANCPDLPDAEEYWIEQNNSIRHAEFREGRCLDNCLGQKIEDRQTGDTYWLSQSTVTGRCNHSPSLPSLNAWESRKGEAKLVITGATSVANKLLLEQCVESEDTNEIVCKGLETEDFPSDSAVNPVSATESLKQGFPTTIEKLVDELGAERKKAYATAIKNLDRKRVQVLTQLGVPTWWTAGELQRLVASEIPMEAKRRRVAMMFANQKQLDRTLEKHLFDLQDSLLSWLPDQDWQPVLRFLERDPYMQRTAGEQLRKNAAGAKRSQSLVCAIDHALGYLCGGGIAPQ